MHSSRTNLFGFTDDALLSAFWLNAIIFVVMMGLFLFFRKTWKRAYEPLTVPEWNANKNFIVKPVEGNFFIGWIVRY